MRPVYHAIGAAILLAQTSLSPAHAANGPVEPLGSVVATVLRHHPDLTLSQIDRALAALAVDRVEATLDGQWTLQVGVQNDQPAVISDFQATDSTLLQAGGGISKPLPGGATVSAGMDYSRSDAVYPPALAAQLARINPSYRGGLNLSYRLPLRRGEGRPEYREGRQVAESERAAVALQRQVVARALALTALNDYFRLLADDIGIRLAEVAVVRAQRLLEYQRFREQYGLVEAADRLQAEALLARRRLERQQAAAQQASDRTALNRLMQRDAAAPLQVNDPPALELPIGPLEALLADAVDQRPEFKILAAQREAAAARLRLARDGDQMQLDVIAELRTYSLDDRAGPALTDSLSTSDRYAGVTVEASDLFGRRAASAEIRDAELSRQRLSAQQAQLEAQVRDQLSAALTVLETGRQTLSMARVHVDAEKRKFDAEMKRYREGRSDTATIVQFESEVHAAELSAELQALTLKLGERQLQWATGTLLASLGIGADDLNRDTGPDSQ